MIKINTLDTKDYPKCIVQTVIPSMIEEKSGHTIRSFQVNDSNNKELGFESIIGQATLVGKITKIHIPEGHMFSVVLVFCQYSRRALIYIVDRKSKVFFYKENHEFAPDSVWADNTMSIIKNLLKESKGQSQILVP